MEHPFWPSGSLELEDVALAHVSQVETSRCKFAGHGFLQTTSALFNSKKIPLEFGQLGLMHSPHFQKSELPLQGSCFSKIPTQRASAWLDPAYQYWHEVKDAHPRDLVVEGEMRRHVGVLMI